MLNGHAKLLADALLASVFKKEYSWGYPPRFKSKHAEARKQRAEARRKK
ncbi:hypothetical protein SmaMPs15_000069 [Stenotrophomonas maltophilia phage vB_SmaM_Ps15]|uniref:Uncharacterized protein n=1 Tax=Stenotrophomonas maltophilia phage vB_SmaM_Ps15 TaxID=3071007 RepID=A0AAE9JUZ5_9CAUD|nr:hypothetical protein PQC01_gp069 [Stenotrophomonas maltophilia phage vB_SmaM_Ps15]UMO77220.1 hypothetical protein SmaMPs15_000069 [Stenotrophomonas maltophilia phage vB_SmaM_Ps15]